MKFISLNRITEKKLDIKIIFSIMKKQSFLLEICVYIYIKKKKIDYKSSVQKYICILKFN